MLPTLRRNVRRLSWTLWLVILAFVVLYIPDLVRQQDNIVARVDGSPILAEDYRRSMQEQIDYYRSLNNGELPEDFLQQIQVEQVVLEQLIRRRLILAASRDQGVTISRQEVRDRILQYEVFRDEDGRFVGIERYRATLAGNGIDLETFEAHLVQDLLVERLTNLMADGVTVIDAEVEETYQRENEKVRFEYLVVHPEDFELEVAESIAGEEVRAHFDKDPEAYRVPERRRLRYVLIDTQAMRDTVELDDEQLRRHYDESIEEHTVEEQVHARHILFRVPPGSDDEEEAEIRERAAGTLARLRQGVDFADQARELSDDPSASAGGDLGWFGRGRMVEGFDEAVFGLQEGETSELVRTAFGFHIIKLEERREEQIRPFEEIRGQIEQQLAWELAEEMSDSLASELRREVLRGRSLDELATTHDLSVQESDLFTREQGLDEVASPVLSERAFAVGEGRVSEPLRVSNGHVVFEVIETQPAHTPEFHEVSERVRGDVVSQNARERGEEVSQEYAARMQDRVELRDLAVEASTIVQATELISRDGVVPQLGRSPTLVLAAFDRQEGESAGPIEVDGKFVLLKVLQHQQPDWTLFASQRETLREQALTNRRNRLFEAFLTSLRDRYSVVVYDEALERLAS